MINSNLIETKVQGQSPFKDAELALTGTVPSLQHLLDIISSILAEEYIMIAKQNPEVFLNNTPRLSELRGCALSGQGANK